MLSVIVWTGFSDFVMGFSGRIHNLVDGSRVPCCTILLLYRINPLSLSYYNLQLELHNILMDTKEVLDRPGATCACVAVLGSHERSKFPVCVYIAVYFHLVDV